jgi:hypothetical protein
MLLETPVDAYIKNLNHPATRNPYNSPLQSPKILPPARLSPRHSPPMPSVALQMRHSTKLDREAQLRLQLTQAPAGVPAKHGLSKYASS